MNTRIQTSVNAAIGILLDELKDIEWAADTVIQPVPGVEQHSPIVQDREGTLGGNLVSNSNALSYELVQKLLRSARVSTEIEKNRGVVSVTCVPDMWVRHPTLGGLKITDDRVTDALEDEKLTALKPHRGSIRVSQLEVRRDEQDKQWLCVRTARIIIKCQSQDRYYMLRTSLRLPSPLWCNTIDLSLDLSINNLSLI